MAQKKYTDGSGVSEIWLNVKNYVYSQLLGKSDVGHTHNVSDITNLSENNGNMTYDGHIVDTIEEQGAGYIRYSNGLQICWGVINGIQFEPFNGHYGKLISYPKSFLANIDPTVNISQWRATGNLTQNVNIYISTESYIGIETDNPWGVSYTVFGMWK